MEEVLRYLYLLEKIKAAVCSTTSVERDFSKDSRFLMRTESKDKTWLHSTKHNVPSKFTQVLKFCEAGRSIPTRRCVKVSCNYNYQCK